MSDSQLEMPFVWPDYRRVAGVQGPILDVNALLAESQLVLGVMHGFSEAGVRRLQKVLTEEISGNQAGNGKQSPPLPEKRLRLIVTLYPACPTTSDTLRALFLLQSQCPSFEVRLVTCELLSGPESTAAFFKTTDAPPTILFGSSANLEDISDEPAHLTMALRSEPILASEWAKWFDVKWLKAVPLTDSRINIPRLVLPEGTEEAARLWVAYEQSCREKRDSEVYIEVSINPVTGEITAESSDGSPVEIISSENKLPKVSPVYRKLSQLLDLGHLVSVDKTTRLLPFEVSVKPKWFGLETLKQIGSVRRQVSYHISALTEQELKQLENRRTKTRELLNLFSFSLADGQRWMPKTAEESFRQENDRVNTEAKGILSNLIAGDLDKFMAERRVVVNEDANRMYRDLFPNHSLSETVLDEIMSELKKRFEEAQQRSFLPQLSFNRISLPQPQDSAWKSQLGSALHLLLSIVCYPRKAFQDGIYFARGMKAKPLDILKAMNPLNDPFVEIFDRSEARERAESELQEVEAIEASDLAAEEKCEKLFELLGHKMTGQANANGGPQKPVKEGDALFDMEDK